MEFSTCKVTKRESRGGRYEGFLRWKSEDGRWRQKSRLLTSFVDPKGVTKPVRTQRQAEKALQQWRVQAEKEMEAAGAKAKLRDYALGYVGNLIDVDPRTRARYRGIINKKFGRLGDVRMCDLTPQMVQKWINGLVDEGLAPSSIARYYTLLRSVCKQAVARRVITHTPCDDNIRRPKVDARRVNALDVEQYKELLAMLEAMDPDPVVTAAYLATCAGLRQGECCALTWGDYDEAAQVIHVHASVAQREKSDGGIVVKSPKTKSGERDVPVTPRLREFLARRREKVLADFEGVGVDRDFIAMGDTCICCRRDGTLTPPSTVNRRWHDLAHRESLVGTEGRYLRFHDLRDAYATLMLFLGAPLTSLAQSMGHSKPDITLRHYAGVLPEAGNRAMLEAAQRIES